MNYAKYEITMLDSEFVFADILGNFFVQYYNHNDVFVKPRAVMQNVGTQLFGVEFEHQQPGPEFIANAGHQQLSVKIGDVVMEFNFTDPSY